MKKISFEFLLFLIFSSFLSCDKERSEEAKAVQKIEADKEFVFKTLSDIYLYSEQTREYVDYTKYENDVELLSKLKHLDDRSSFITSAPKITDWDESQEYFGIGAKFIPTANGNVCVSIVYEESDLYRSGVKGRGWKVEKINEKEVTASNFFKLIGLSENADPNITMVLDSLGKKVVVKTYKDILKANSVISSKIFQQSGYNVGYLVYDSFHKFSKNQLIEVFNQFQQSEIEKLVLDLRYNSSGTYRVASQLAVMINNRLAGKEFFELHHNNQFLSQDTTIFFPIDDELNYLNLEELIVLTSSQTSNVSNLFINSLKKYISVVCVGAPTTQSSQGLYKLKYSENEKVFASLAYSYNKLQNSVYPDIPELDNVLIEFANPYEVLLKSALDYIETNEIVEKEEIEFNYNAFQFDGFKAYIGGAL